MNYVELDIKNLAKWFSGTIGASGLSTKDPNVAPNNFVVYVSDRRSNYVPPVPFAGVWPPLSPLAHETGEYGYSDFVNPGDIKGCPNDTLDNGEDVDGTGILYTYGGAHFNGMMDSTGSITANTLFANALNATQADPLCAGSKRRTPLGTHFPEQPQRGPRESVCAIPSGRENCERESHKLAVVSGRRHVRPGSRYGKPRIPPGRLQRQFGQGGWPMPTSRPRCCRCIHATLERLERN